jgi:gliding motility-associated-like protein
LFLIPNNDGFNDYWQIKGMDAFPDAVIFIFDRYGEATEIGLALPA